MYMYITKFLNVLLYQWVHGYMHDNCEVYNNYLMYILRLSVSAVKYTCMYMYVATKHVHQIVIVIVIEVTCAYIFTKGA